MWEPTARRVWAVVVRAAETALERKSGTRTSTSQSQALVKRGSLVRMGTTNTSIGRFPTGARSDLLNGTESLGSK